MRIGVLRGRENSFPDAVIAKVSVYEDGGKVRVPGMACCILGTR